MIKLIAMKKGLLVLVIWLIVGLMASRKAEAASLGIHLLDPRELPVALELASGGADNLGAVTVVLRSDDRNRQTWQEFLEQAAGNRIRPIIRLATNSEGKGWRRPNRRDVVEAAEFLSSLDWQTDTLTVVVFNEPNHGAEWGGRVDAEGYARTLAFAADWFHTESKEYVVLPAGLDAATANGKETMENLTFMRKMLTEEPSLINQIDGWTVHAYANPGFAGSPQDKSKMSIRSFNYEINMLKKYSPKELNIYITEAGWKRTRVNEKYLGSYYVQAVRDAWSNQAVVAITPFVYSAQDGPFREFSFMNADGSPTPQYQAWLELKQGIKLSYRQ